MHRVIDIFTQFKSHIGRIRNLPEREKKNKMLVFIKVYGSLLFYLSQENYAVLNF